MAEMEKIMTFTISTTIKEISLNFQTESSLFSPKNIDSGTLAMLSAVDFLPNDKVLDLGCGYGVVGILAAKFAGEDNVVLCDSSETAVKYAKLNAETNLVPEIDIIQSNGFEHISDNNFTLILSNPPYHTDFSVAKHFIEEGFQRLAIGGRMVMVTKRLDWYKNKLTAIFGGVRIQEIDGYYVFTAEKRKQSKGSPKQKAKNCLSKKLQRKQKNRCL